MTWFGWLLKPHLQISLLDGLIGFGELILVVVVYALVASFIERLKNGSR